jgi:hypothetical protein
MLKMLSYEKEDITAYSSNMVDIAQRLWLNNGITERQFDELKRLYRAVLSSHDYLRNRMEAAREPGL